MAQFSLGYLYYLGLGVPEDDTEAAKWLRRAADQSHPQLQYKLGTLYEGGTGVGKDFTEALKWYQMAATAGLPAAQSDYRRLKARLELAPER